MAGRGGRRDAEAAVRIGTGNVFAALEALKRKKKKPPSSSSASSSAAAAPGRKGKGSTKKAAAPPPPPPEVFWAPAPLKSKSWADVEDDDDDDYFATTAPPPPVWGTASAPAAPEGKSGAEEVSIRFSFASTYVLCIS
jgi:hypothetical protein